jgi:hypothetical protein
MVEPFDVVLPPDKTPINKYKPFNRMKRKSPLRRLMPALFGIISSLVLLLTAYAMARPLWNRLIVYPQLNEERTALHEKYRKPAPYILQNDYKGVLHSHTYRSHDSRGVLPEIIPAAQKAKLNFIFLADHRKADQDTFPRGIHGTYHGIIVESGTESPGASMMVSPLRPTILDWSKERNALIKEVTTQGGMVFYLHSEDPSHDWANPDYQGMEIYNIHTDLIDEKSPLKFLFNAMVNGSRYKDWSYRELFDEQSKIVALWDSLNQQRRIVGIAAVDAHNNQSIRARYLPDGQVEWVGSNAKTLSVTKPGWKEKWLLGKPDVAGWSFKMELDTYFHSFNFVNTHIFGDTLSSHSLKNELVKGHAYISFESLAEAKGFQFLSLDAAQKVTGIMGDSVSNQHAVTLKTVSPFPARLELYKNGKLIDFVEDSYSHDFAVKHKSGNYRVVARLKFRGAWLPWIYSNPIYVY